MRKNRRSSADDILEAAIDGAIIGSGIALTYNILGSIFDNDSINPPFAESPSDSTPFGGGDFGGAGAGGEW